MFQPNQQLPLHVKPLTIQDPSALTYAGLNDSPNAARDGGENGGYYRAESVVYSSKKIENEMLMIGKKIKQHEENIKFLKSHNSSLDDSILDMQVTLGKYHSSSAPMTEDEDLSYIKSEEEIIQQIIFTHETSAAGILCQLKKRGAQLSQIASTKDVVGIVATLGKVADDKLSSLLSEYLGLDTMLAVVCKTYDGIKALENYEREGTIDTSSALYGLASTFGKSLDGQFVAFCLESLRPYVGGFIADDPQRRLDIVKPKLASGESPPGFLGFAVNMIHIDSANLYCLTASGDGLRETLFYSLFSRLQVYRTKTDMLQAIPCISHGAVSLDGGMMRSPGVFSLGIRKGEVKVKFPISSGVSYLPEDYAELERRLKETKWKKERMMEDMRREEQLLNHEKICFEMKKQQLIQCLAQSSPYSIPPMQHPMQASQGRFTPR